MLYGVRVEAVRVLAPRIYEGGDTSAHTGIGGSSYNRTQIIYPVIPNQSSDWCGNPRRHCVTGTFNTRQQKSARRDSPAGSLFIAYFSKIMGRSPALRRV